jgi:DNA processing protein
VNETIVHERDLNKPAITDDSIRQSVIAALGPSPTGIDDILHFTGAGTGDVQLVLMELSLAGRLERHSGNRVSLITG